MALTQVVGGLIANNSIGASQLATSGLSASALTTGTLPKAQLPAGTVLQVVNVSYTSNPAFSSASYVDTGLSATITPTSATSKILVIAAHHGIEKGNAGNSYAYIKIVRGAVDVGSLGGELAWDADSVAMNIGGVAGSYLDSPATTGATTYKTQVYVAGGSSFALNYGGSTMTLMEIAA